MYSTLPECAVTAAGAGTGVGAGGSCVRGRWIMISHPPLQSSPSPVHTWRVENYRHAREVCKGKVHPYTTHTPPIVTYVCVASVSK